MSSGLWLLATVVWCRFQKDGVDLDARVAVLAAAMEAVLCCHSRDMLTGLGAARVGVHRHGRNQPERTRRADVQPGASSFTALGTDRSVQCFYLSIARSYLSGAKPSAGLTKETALHLKRVIEAAVLQANPHWAGDSVGEHIQAFSDFLFYVIDSHALLSELAVVVFDSVSGGVEVYKGHHFPDAAHPDGQRSNLVTIKYVPGHYQSLVPLGAEGPTLDELLLVLDQFEIQYATTTG